MEEHRTGRPSTSADFIQDIDAAGQADRPVSITQLEIRFNLSLGTLFMNVSATGQFAPGGFPIN
jgi:hypothetical protein